MLADWEVEVGGDAQVIDGAWPGFVDLRSGPGGAAELAECQAWPELIAPLDRLNAVGSLVWTSKCDAWVMRNFAAEDRDEYAAKAEDVCAVACYIDLLAWRSLGKAEEFCRAVKERLVAVELDASRVEFVVREARLAGGGEAYGITAYTAGCGATAAAARVRIGRALEAWADGVR